MSARNRIDDKDLRRIINEKNPDEHPSPFDRMEYREPPGQARSRREIQTPDGRRIYAEDRIVTVNPYDASQEQRIIQITEQCEGCGLPVTAEMLALDLIKPCAGCGRKTCPRCRMNTNLHEYLKIEIRGQTLCDTCWHRLSKQFIITCPNCHQPAKDYYDLKLCGGCGTKICPACGVPSEYREIICIDCHQAILDRQEAQRRADELFREALGGL